MREHPTDLLPELALGVLTEAEAAEIHAHLITCEPCKSEYEEMAHVARLLPLAAEDLAPSPRLKESLFERIGSEPHNLPSTRLAVAPNVIRPRPWQWYGAAAAAAVLLVGAVGFTGFAIGGASNGDDADLARQAQVVESAARGDLKVSRSSAGAAKVSVVRAPGSGQAFALVEGLPTPGEGKAYQAWFSRDGKTMEPARVFTSANGGVWLEAAGALDGYSLLAFTIEDSAGAKQPTQDPFVVVDFSKSTALSVR